MESDDKGLRWRTSGHTGSLRKPDIRACKDYRELAADKADSVLKRVEAGRDDAQAFDGAKGDGEHHAGRCRFVFRYASGGTVKNHPLHSLFKNQSNSNYKKIVRNEI
jgi:hypothetical protein